MLAGVHHDEKRNASSPQLLITFGIVSQSTAGHSCTVSCFANRLVAQPECKRMETQHKEQGDGKPTRELPALGFD